MRFNNYNTVIYKQQSTMKSVVLKSKNALLVFCTSRQTCRNTTYLDGNTLIIPHSSKRLGRYNILHTDATMQYSTIQYNTIQYNTIQYNTTRLPSQTTRSRWQVDKLGSHWLIESPTIIPYVYGPPLLDICQLYFKTYSHY